jgi:hypothetical protein
MRRALSIAASYEGTAYAEFADPLVYRHLAAPLATVLDEIDGPVLDVATGPGALCRDLPDVVAIDLSWDQLSCNPQSRKVLADAHRIPFTDDSFAAAGSAFGVNHFPDAATAIAEMARVAPLVGLLTWVRPEPPYKPKQVVLDVIERHTGARRSEVGMALEEMSESVGSIAAIDGLLTAAGLNAKVTTVEVEVPWPGAEQFVDYRLSMSEAFRRTPAAEQLRRDAIEAVSTLDEDDVRWTPPLVLGIGTRAQRP